MIKENPHAVMEKSHAEGLAYCLTIGTSHQANQQVKTISQECGNVYGTLGFHPHGASQTQNDHLDWIKKEVQTNQKMVAIGECGYDLFYEHSPKNDQTIAFKNQLDLALELEMPIVIHSRDADSETRTMLDAYKHTGLSGVVHCFTSDLSQAKYLLDAGLYLSFNGICTFPQAQEVRDVLKYTPPDRILLETDAPYLSPVPFRGKANYPGRVSLVGKFIANYLNLSEEAFAEQISHNTKALFTRIDYEN